MRTPRIVLSYPKCLRRATVAFATRGRADASTPARAPPYLILIYPVRLPYTHLSITFICLLATPRATYVNDNMTISSFTRSLVARQRDEFARFARWITVLPARVRQNPAATRAASTPCPRAHALRTDATYDSNRRRAQSSSSSSASCAMNASTATSAAVSPPRTVLRARESAHSCLRWLLLASRVSTARARRSTCASNATAAAAISSAAARRHSAPGEGPGGGGPRPGGGGVGPGPGGGGPRPVRVGDA